MVCFASTSRRAMVRRMASSGIFSKGASRNYAGGAAGRSCGRFDGRLDILRVNAAVRAGTLHMRQIDAGFDCEAPGERTRLCAVR